jgi:CarD family transcriptional regulator
MLYFIRGKFSKEGTALFKIGDKVVYPMHGAGVIESIEEKEVLGEKRQYYILRLPVGDMKVMIPITNGAGVGLREVIDRDGVQKVIHILRDQSTAMSPNWNRRYRANLEKIKSGNVYEVAEVVRNLIKRDREKGLSSGERKMLENARQILVSELVLATELEEDKAQSLVDGAFA